MTTTAVEHDHHVEVTTHGARVVCSCGWVSCPTLEEAYETKPDALRRWYDHFVYRSRL